MHHAVLELAEVDTIKIHFGDHICSRRRGPWVGLMSAAAG